MHWEGCEGGGLKRGRDPLAPSLQSPVERLPLEVEELDGNAFLYQVHAYIPTKVFVPHFEDLWAKPQPLVDSSLTVPCLTLRLWKTVMVTGVALNLRLLTSQVSFRLPAVILRSLVTFLLCA